MFVHCIAFTKNGAKLCANLAQKLAPESVGYAPINHCVASNLTPLMLTVGEWAKEHFNSREALVFIGAAGIAVRCIAPLVTAKSIDPAVICIDEKGEYVIPLLSGHIGGANTLARKIAKLIKAKPIITTATDVQDVFAVDTWATQIGCAITDTTNIKYISSVMLEGGTVGLSSDFPVDGPPPPGLVETEDLPCGVRISLRKSEPYKKTLHLIPRCLRVGIGCRKGIEYDHLERFLLQLLKEHNLPVEALESIASISLKVREPAILELCERYRLPLNVFTPGQLSEVEGEFASSDFVKGITGVDNVCERAAMYQGGRLLVSKTVSDGITLAVVQSDWRAAFSI